MTPTTDYIIAQIGTALYVHADTYRKGHTVVWSPFRVEALGFPSFAAAARFATMIAKPEFYTLGVVHRTLEE